MNLIVLLSLLLTFPPRLPPVGAFLAQVPPITINSFAEFDCSPNDSTGRPELYGEARLALTLTTIDLVATPTGATIATDRFSIGSVGGHITRPLGLLLAGVTAGNYRLWVQSIDAAGNFSKPLWAAPLAVTVGLPLVPDTTPPIAPTGLKVSTTITLTSP
jgi:hypothetical protein